MSDTGKFILGLIILVLFIAWVKRDPPPKPEPATPEPAPVKPEPKPKKPC